MRPKPALEAFNGRDRQTGVPGKIGLRPSKKCPGSSELFDCNQAIFRLIPFGSHVMILLDQINPTNDSAFRTSNAKATKTNRGRNVRTARASHKSH